MNLICSVDVSFTRRENLLNFCKIIGAIVLGIFVNFKAGAVGKYGSGFILDFSFDASNLHDLCLILRLRHVLSFGENGLLWALVGAFTCSFFHFHFDPVRLRSEVLDWRIWVLSAVPRALCTQFDKRKAIF